jgi:MFS family permease
MICTLKFSMNQPPADLVRGIGTPIFIAVIPSIATSWNITNATLETLPASLYPFGLGVGALLATAGSEVFGRRIVYQVTVPLSLAFTIMGGVAKNYVYLCIARSLAGLFSGPCLTVGAGIFNDLWDTSLEKIGTLFAVLFVVFLIWATQLGPMVSGAILTDHSWRWTFWVSCVLVGVTLIGAFMIPETYHPQILRNKVKPEELQGPSRQPAKMFLIAVGRPIHMTFVEPIVFPVGLVLAITQSIVFAY